MSISGFTTFPLLCRLRDSHYLLPPTRNWIVFQLIFKEAYRWAIWGGTRFRRRNSEVSTHSTFGIIQWRIWEGFSGNTSGACFFYLCDSCVWCCTSQCRVYMTTSCPWESEIQTCTVLARLWIGWYFPTGWARWCCTDRTSPWWNTCLSCLSHSTSCSHTHTCPASTIPTAIMRYESVDTFQTVLHNCKSKHKL